MFERVTGLKGGSQNSIRKASKTSGDIDRRMRRRRKRHLDQMDETSNELAASYDPNYKKQEEQAAIDILRQKSTGFDEKRKANRRSMADVFEMTKNRARAEDSDDDDDMGRTPEEHEENTDLMNGKDVDALLQATKEVLTRRINFVPAKKVDSYAKLFDKLKPLNGTHNTGEKPATLYEMTTAQKKKKAVVEKSELADIVDDHDTPLHKPAYYLFDPNLIAGMMEWKEVQRVGGGLYNLGNTCFMNAALQCLVYTPPLHNYLLTRKITTNTPGFNPTNEMSKLVKALFQQKTNNAYSPKELAHNLKYIGHFRLGRQEDSHEFIINLIDKMEESIIKSYKNKLDKRVAETNPIHQIFGGYLRSQVECIDSKYISNTYDAFIGISLQLDTGSSIERCFKQYIEPDILEGKNAYKCPLTKKYERAKKRLTIHEAPPVLILHLKRFSIFGKKINKHISYGEEFDLEPYMSKETEQDAKYKLCGVLVHSGNSCHSGHYYSYVKNSNGVWYRMDDSRVAQVQQKAALEQHAYILFYVREGMQSFPEPARAEEPPTPIKTPSKPNEVFEQIMKKEQSTMPPPTPQTKKKAESVFEKKVTEPSSPRTKAIEPPKKVEPVTEPSSPVTPTTPSQVKKELVFEPRTPTTPVSALFAKKRAKRVAKTLECCSPLKPHLCTSHHHRKKDTGPFSHTRLLKHLLQNKQDATLEEADQPPPTPQPKLDSPVQPPPPTPTQKTPVKIAFDPKAYTKQTQGTNLGQQMESWDKQAEASQKAALDALSREENKNKRKREVWDQLMDMGKTKKIRIKETTENWENRAKSFQHAHEMKVERAKFELEKRAEDDKYEDY